MSSESLLLNSSVALTATEAAIDIDDILLGRPKNLVAIQRLAMHLHGIVGAGTPIHPLDHSILIKAIEEAGDQNNFLVNLVKPMSKVEEIVERLRDERTFGDPKTLEQMERFCLALSQAIMSARSILRHSHRMPG